MYINYIDDLFDLWRGIKGLALDIRRCKEKVIEVCDHFDEIAVNKILAKLDSLPDGYGKGIKNYYDGNINALAHTMLRDKDTEIFFIKPWKKILDAAQAKHKVTYANIEGDFLHRTIGDFFGDYDKGTICITVEQDDPFEVRKAYPNLSLYGGLKVDILGNGTAEQSVDMAKKAIDELGYNGGLYLAPNKMVSYSYDMTSENIKAVEITSNVIYY